MRLSESLEWLTIAVSLPVYQAATDRMVEKIQDPQSSQIAAGSLPETQLQDSHKEINKTSRLESKGLSEEAP